MKHWLLWFLGILLIIGCARHDFSPRRAIEPANMDLSVSPDDDFYQFANGNWLKNHPVPADYSRFGSFEEVTEKNLRDLRQIMEDAARTASLEKGSNVQKIGDFYASGMDTEKIEQDGLTPIQPLLNDIAVIRTVPDVQSMIAALHRKGISPLFHFFAEPDPKNSTLNIGWFYQGGLGLPDRDYYLDSAPRSEEIRNEYYSHLVRIFQLLGESQKQAEESADAILTIEKRLAQASMTRVEQRDPKATYHPTTLRQLQRKYHNYHWITYMNQMGAEPSGQLNVAQPLFFQEINRMIRQIPVDKWQDYLRWHLIRATSPYLSSNFEVAHFEFYGKYLSGTREMQPRWKRVLNTTSRALGEAVGQMYVERYFPPEAKERALELVYNLKHAYAKRMQNLDWMSATTKEKALEKLDAFRIKIGYPEKWVDYSDLDISRDSYVTNVLNADAFEVRRNMQKINKPVDVDEWHMSPQTVNAYYNPAVNEIVFPAAILQPPFFNFKADDPVNYGAIGAVIGHEMTHGFDDQGRHYDKNGNLNDWWTAEDEEKFNARTRILVEQANNYVAIDTFTINGELTLGENIADLGGLTIAFEALKMAMEQNQPKTNIDGFTPEQRFFLSWAQVWRSNIRRENQLLRFKTDVHSPAKYRTNGPLSNLPEFHQAFNVTQGQKLYRPPEEVARIW